MHAMLAEDKQSTSSCRQPPSPFPGHAANCSSRALRSEKSMSLAVATHMFELNTQHIRMPQFCRSHGLKKTVHVP